MSGVQSGMILKKLVESGITEHATVHEIAEALNLGIKSGVVKCRTKHNESEVCVTTWACDCQATDPVLFTSPEAFRFSATTSFSPERSWQPTTLIARLLSVPYTIYRLLFPLA